MESLVRLCILKIIRSFKYNPREFIKALENIALATHLLNEILAELAFSEDISPSIIFMLLHKWWKEGEFFLVICLIKQLISSIAKHANMNSSFQLD